MAQSSPLAAQFLMVLGTLALAMAPEKLLPGLAGRVRETLRLDQFNESDYERMERGYYERLLDVGRQLGDLVGPVPGGSESKTMGVSFDAGPLTLKVGDLREFVLRPDLTVVREGVKWSTNCFGMRDQPYAVAKPPGCVRIAVVGDSIGAGWGVDDDRGFEPLLERRLDERSVAVGGPAVEILNFAVPGYAPGQRWEHFTRVGWTFDPGVVIYEATLADPGWDERRLRGLLPRGIGWDSPMYRAALIRAGARPGGDFESYKRVLSRSRWDMLAGVYRTIVDDCRARGVPAIWILLPRVGKVSGTAERAHLLALARGSGFTAVLDLSDTFDGIEPRSLAIGPSDYHPNAVGHALLAERLETILTAQPELRFLWNATHTGTKPR